jgi:Flp pilus assembly protein TadG
MSLIKLTIAVVVLGVVGLFAYDGVQVLNAQKNIRDTASAVAGAAAHAIATSKDCATSKPPAAAASTTPAATTTATKTCAGARTVADKTAQSQGDVVTSFTYDPVAARVSVTISGSAKSLVLHYFDRSLTDNIKASSSARPA